MQDKKPEIIALDDDGLVTVTTPEYVKDSIKDAIEEHAKSRNHPYATQTEPGFVTLSNETDSNSEVTVATSKAVKNAYDLANTANQNALNNHSDLYLEKNQNGADVPDKKEFVKNIGLTEALTRVNNTALLTENGWWQCGDTGLIIQWGRSSDRINDGIPIKWPQKFPNAVLSISTMDPTNGNNDGNTSIQDITTSGGTLYRTGSAGTAMWIVIGF